jgi:hypothetical protein
MLSIVILLFELINTRILRTPPSNRLPWMCHFSCDAADYGAPSSLIGGSVGFGGFGVSGDGGF